jgi:starch phosphorylase
MQPINETLKDSILRHLHLTLARDEQTATNRDWWLATSHAVRDRLLSRYMRTQKAHNESNTRRMYYLSLEYLLGRLFNNYLYNAGVHEELKTALSELDLDPSILQDEESEMGLGNGGLGRLAACFLDSLATLDLPAIGYGIFYEFGLFQQAFERCHQVEYPDSWNRYGTPWEVIRPEYVQEVHIYGKVKHIYDNSGNYVRKWSGGQTIIGLPHDLPIPGYGTGTVNFLRLWESKASSEFDLKVFNEGGYVEAVREKAIGESISKVLYPNDQTESGKELRLVQQYFFVTCSLKDILRRFLKQDDDWNNLPKQVAIQLNDTHPAVAVLELMRLLTDVYNLDWDHAWKLCRRTFSYTNHTLLPEALEKWSVSLFEKVLPRHLEIVYQINNEFLKGEVETRWPGDGAKKAELSLIEEGKPKMIRMAYLSVVASHAVNGVAALHTQLLRRDLFHSFDELYPEKIRNKTNGITPRRWLLACNPGLSSLIHSKIGDGWVRDLDQLRQLETHADDPIFQDEFLRIKHENKMCLGDVIEDALGFRPNADAIYDVQIKRLHEYKRQHLNLLHILTLYRRLLNNPSLEIQPRLFIFGAKAAPGYDIAKNIIRAINLVAATINHDQRIQGKLQIAYLPNYNVSLAEKIIPAADLSEQISTAGKEASGTGNMKFALNGALTIGTLDGANVEIGEEVGEENIFIFGLKVDEVQELRDTGYNPQNYVDANEELAAVLGWLRSGHFSPGEPDALKPLVQSLTEWGDPFLVLADYETYLDAQERVDQAYRDRRRWARMAILNTARVGKFSSDRTIAEYASDIWNLKPISIAP